MVYPIIPLYLVSVLGATPALIGVIEGIAESLASLLKVFSGYITDRFRKKKSLAFIGYASGIIYKIALLLAGTWVGILGARIIDRIGKGIRTAPRDVLVSESVDKNDLGKGFGLHKAMDMFGSAIGILIAFLLLRSMLHSINYTKLFMIAIIPAILGLSMFFFIKEKQSTCEINTNEPFWKNIKSVDRQLWIYLIVVFIFTLGNSSKVFILLRAQSVGFDTVNVVLLYFIMNMTGSVLSMPLGKLSDKIGRKKLLVPGYLAFSLCYFGFAFADKQWMMVAVFVIYGAYAAMITGVERAYVVDITPPELKGTMLGLQSTIAGIALLPASVIAGFLWDSYGAAVPFIFGAVLSLIAAIILTIFMRNINLPVSTKM